MKHLWRWKGSPGFQYLLLTIEELKLEDSKLQNLLGTNITR